MVLKSNAEGRKRKNKAKIEKYMEYRNEGQNNA
jgi:hypothetical protein